MEKSGRGGSFCPPPPPILNRVKIYFYKKTDLLLYNMKQVIIFIEIVICVAVDCENESRQGKA